MPTLWQRPLVVRVALGTPVYRPSAEPALKLASLAFYPERGIPFHFNQYERCA